MSVFSFPPNTTKKTNFSSVLLSDFFRLCSFIISHPLYFSYFIFFSPYIIKILSFLSPLFITTSLLLLALFTTFVHDTSCSQLCVNADDGSGQSLNFEDLEAYKIVFDTSSTTDIREYEVSEEIKIPISEITLVDKHMCHESLAEIMKADQSDDQSFLKEEDSDDFVDVSCEEGEKEVIPLSFDELKKVDEQKLELHNVSSCGSKGMSKVRVNSQRLDGADDDHLLWSSENGGEFYNSPSCGSSLGSFGSMRKEKEWRRTLACKLFEERHNRNVEGSDEGMDMLWETYEADSKKQQHLLAKSKTKKGKKGGKWEYDDDEQDEEDDDDDGQLCCLQALKFSAGKMNLGMGRPNLFKISKAFKGIGWLHNVTKHGKKIYH